MEHVSFPRVIHEHLHYAVQQHFFLEDVVQRQLIFLQHYCLEEFYDFHVRLNRLKSLQGRYFLDDFVAD